MIAIRAVTDSRCMLPRELFEIYVRRADGTVFGTRDVDRDTIERDFLRAAVPAGNA